MLISFRSPKGGQPLRLWMQTIKKGVPTLTLANQAEPVINNESIYCLKIGYNKDGTDVLIRDTEAGQLYLLLKKHYT